MADPDRMTYLGEDFSMRSPEQMKKDWRDQPEVIANTLKIAELLGAHTGDGTLYKTKNSFVWELRGGLDEKEYYNENIKNLLKSIFKIEFLPKFRSGGKNGCYGIQPSKFILRYCFCFNIFKCFFISIWKQNYFCYYFSYFTNWWFFIFCHFIDFIANIQSQ